MGGYTLSRIHETFGHATEAGSVDLEGYSTSASGATAGPFKAVPPTAKREPWQGQSQQCSREFTNGVIYKITHQAGG
jgi:hypothetical protein